MALLVLRTRELLKFISTKIYSHRETYSNKAELRLQRHEYAVVGTPSPIRITPQAHRDTREYT